MFKDVLTGAGDPDVEKFLKSPGFCFLFCLFLLEADASRGFDHKRFMRKKSCERKRGKGRLGTPSDPKAME